ncbi:MAG: TonB-dependent receptor [Bacteroidota bacterium]
MRCLFKYGLATTLFLSGFGYGLFAQSLDSLEVESTLQTLELEEVAISAVRASKKAPIPFTNVSKKEIEKVYVGQHPIFLLEKLTPGLFAFSESGTSLANYGQLRLRGINQERINFTLNGVPLNDMIDQGVFFSNFTDITSNFESIQVQRGVGTSSNGVSSYGGSINFETTNLRDKEPFTTVQLGVGSFDTYRGSFQHFTGINKKGWGFMTGFSGLTSDGFRDNTDTDATSFFLTGGYYGDKDLLKFTFFTARSENGLGYQTVEESILDENPTFNPLSNNDEDDFRQFLFQTQYNRILSDYWTLGVTGYYGGAGGDFVTFGLNFPLQNDHFGTIINADYAKGNLVVNTGLHAYIFLRENEESELDNLANPFYNEESRKNEVSWFGKVEYELGNLTAFADLQIRTTELIISPDFNAIGIAPTGDLTFDWTFVNPKIGFNYNLNDALSLYTSFGRSGREPTKIDIFGGFRLDSTNFESVINNNFNEEFVNDFEFGARLSMRNLTIDGNFYFMDFNDEIAPIGDFLAFGVQERRNISNSRRSGFEMSWAYQPIEKLNFSGNFAYLDTKIKSLTLNGEELRDREQILSPDLIINGQLSYQLIDELKLSVSGRYLGKQFMELTNNPDFVVPSSFVSDLQFEAIISPTITISAFVNNVFNNDYFTFGAPSDTDFSGTLEPGFFIQPERNYYLSLTLNL